MKKLSIYRLIKGIFRFSIKSLLFLLKIAFIVFFCMGSNHTTEDDEWENDYDELTADVTKRNHFF